MAEPEILNTATKSFSCQSLVPVDNEELSSMAMTKEENGNLTFYRTSDGKRVMKCTPTV